MEEGSIMNVFNNLLLDEWYKPIVYLGGIILIGSLFAPLQIPESNRLQILLVSLGAFLWGIGEWQNHYYQYPIFMGRGNTSKKLMRLETSSGRIFNHLGLLCIAVGLVWLVYGLL